MIAVLQFFLLMFATMLSGFLVVVALLVTFDLLPSKAKDIGHSIAIDLFSTSIGRLALERPLLNYMPWYVRGSVLGQNSHLREEKDLEAQRSRAVIAMRRLTAICRT